MIQTRVLDKGLVALLDTMPQHSEIEPGYSSLDNAIVSAARTSFNGVSKGTEADKRLLMRLWRDKHTSPFEMVEFKFLIDAPMLVYWQWVRHRTFSFQSVNSQSGRYTELANDETDLYIPSVWRKQSESNKQASDGQVSVNESLWFSQQLEDVYKECIAKYRFALKVGVAREQARLFLPGFAVYYRWIVKVDLLNLFHFLRLRLADDAQYEIRQYAEAIYGMVKVLAPWSAQAFEETRG